MPAHGRAAGHCSLRDYALPRDFTNFWKKEKVTITEPDAGRRLSDHSVEASGPARALALRYVIFGGEALNFVRAAPMV